MRRILITGAAKRLGRLLALKLGEAGHFVILHYHTSADDAANLSDYIKSHGGHSTTVGADLNDAGTSRTLIDEAQRASGGPLCALVNNASSFEYDSPLSPSSAISQEAYHVNFHTPADLSAHFLEACNHANDNCIVNILDQKLWNMNPDFASYTASKAALLAWTTMLDMAAREKGRAAAIAPGILYPSHDQSKEEFNAVASMNLLKRPIGTDDVAHALDFILQARHFRSQVLHIDNGQRFLTSDRDIMFSTRNNS